MDKADESIAHNEEIENGAATRAYRVYFHFQKRPAESNCGVMATSPALLIYPLLSPTATRANPSEKSEEPENSSVEKIKMDNILFIVTPPFPQNCESLIVLLIEVEGASSMPGIRV